MLEELLRSFGLIGGGDCYSHMHPNIISLDELHRMQQLEVVVFIDSNYVCREQDDYVFVDATSGSITITLHPADYGQHVTISRIKGSGVVTIEASPGETVNLAPSITIIENFKPRRLKALVKDYNSTSIRYSSQIDTPVDKGYLEI